MKRYVLTRHNIHGIEIYDTFRDYEFKLFTTTDTAYRCIYGKSKSSAVKKFIEDNAIAESDNLDELYERLCLEML